MSLPFTRRVFVALLLGVGLLASCKELTKGKGKAEAAIVDFHKQFNEGKFKEIYAAVHPDFKAASTEEEFIKLLDAIQRKLGKHVKSTEGGWAVKSYNLKTTGTFTQESEFEQGKGTEIFTFALSGESCILQGYHINSKDMMLK